MTQVCWIGNEEYMFLPHGKLMPGMEKWLGKLLIPEGKLLIPREKVVFPSEARQNILPRNQKFARGNQKCLTIFPSQANSIFHVVGYIFLHANSMTEHQA